jgi:hypothetical protein
METWEGGGAGSAGSAVRKIYCTGPWKLATIPLYNLLKSPKGTQKLMYIKLPMGL